jgi:hypothetical protein
VSGEQTVLQGTADIAANGRVDRNVGRNQPQAAARLFDDADAGVELHIQSVLSRRRRFNASGQAGEDIGNIRAALRSVPPNAKVTGPERSEGPVD